MKLRYVFAAVLFFLIMTEAKSNEIVRLSGSPREIGRAHAKKARRDIKLMLQEYIGSELEGGKLKVEWQSRIDRLKKILPNWYSEELQACAKESGVDRDALLFAQCEGDIRSLPGCTTYVAMEKASGSGKMEIGRNFDYWGIDSATRCVRTFLFKPSQEKHYSFISVGWAGILGGWTFYNEHGLFVANNLGGFAAKNPYGIPTLILERMIAETCATIDEAIDLIKKTPRMRGQALMLAQWKTGKAKASKQIYDKAVLVLYDADKVEIQRPESGFLFHSSVGFQAEEIRKALKSKSGHIYDRIRLAGNPLTLHSVAIDQEQDIMWIAHGRRPAHEGTYVPINLDEIFGQ